jgi:hypothetical protein
MNRRKSEHRVPASAYFALIAAAALAAAGGILHAYYKNRQIQIAREIDAIETRIEQCQLDIRTTQYRTDQLLNRFVIKKQLEESGSALVSIPVGLPEEVNPSAPNTPTPVTPRLTP